ncbi:hypothetical protein SAMN05216559_3622 [Halomicrobium zhouii]|uniref:Uncharacterized protein n=1 Tax=Halomicrobium zhouii TaxID=767519 RepID=A0A1I6M313_9EURY|nr:hypothetical protein [Halomicrobium zhouii]SFS09932.1 hypothetical protein SAMN05216559_3622 [Halomicrobium zhouii]
MAIALGTAAFSLQEAFVDEPGVVDSDVRPVYDFTSSPAGPLVADWGGDLPAAVRRDMDRGCALLDTALEKTAQTSASTPRLYDEAGTPLVSRDDVDGVVEDGADDETYWLVPGVVRRHSVDVPDGPKSQLTCDCRAVATPHAFVGWGGAPRSIPELERPIWVCRRCGRPAYGPDPDGDSSEKDSDVIPGPDGTPVQTTLPGGPAAEHERQLSAFYDEYGRYPWDDGPDG